MSEQLTQEYARKILLQRLAWSVEAIDEFLEQGWTSEALLKATHIGYCSPGDISLVSYWDKRYLIEGHIWGDEPSTTVKLLAEELPSCSRVLEVGFGYGRDLFELVKQGHKVTGIEISMVSFAMANASYQRLRRYDKECGLGRAEILRANFTTATLGKYDALYSHRTIHLVHDAGLLRSFINSSVRATRPDGLFFLSARDDRDFDEEQMEWEVRGPGKLAVARYKTRPDHRISFWNVDRCQAAFGKYFEILYAQQDEEVESLSNAGKRSKFTIFAMRRKTVAEIR